jgi:hypothetical protein
MDVTTGSIVANISTVAGVDQVAYDSNAQLYFASAYQNLAGGISTGAPQPQLAIIDAKTNKLIQTITTDNVTAHSVAVDPVTNNVIVPLTKSGLAVYSSNSTTSGTTPSTTSSGSKNIHTLYGVGFALFAGVILS